MFGKKKEPKAVPVNDIYDMRQAGMDDRAIIKDLKKKGYSYEDIEKAMLQSVKEGVNDNPIMRSATKQQPEFVDFSGAGDFMNQQPQAEMQEELGLTDADFHGAEDANIIIEEIVEGVVQEKLVKFEERIKNLEETLMKYGADIKVVEKKADENPNVQSKISSYDARFNEVHEQLDDLQARIGGVEKAFKQFLPSLTKNIESLSEMIHELKQKQEHSHQYNYHHENEVRA